MTYWQAVNAGVPRLRFAVAAEYKRRAGPLHQARCKWSWRITCYELRRKFRALPPVAHLNRIEHIRMSTALASLKYRLNIQNFSRFLIVLLARNRKLRNGIRSNSQRDDARRAPRIAHNRVSAGDRTPACKTSSGKFGLTRSRDRAPVYSFGFVMAWQPPAA